MLVDFRHMYLFDYPFSYILRFTKMTNPFDENDRSNKPRNGFDNVKSYSSNGTIEDDVDFYEKEIKRYKQESLDSTQRSQQHLESSEQLGVKTAQVCFN